MTELPAASEGLQYAWMSAPHGVFLGALPGTTQGMNTPDDPLTDSMEDDARIDSDALNTDALNTDALDTQPDGDRQLTTASNALDEGGSNDSDLGADVAGDIGPKHD